MTPERQQQLKTILDQLTQSDRGFARVQAMVGATNFLYDDKNPLPNLSFRIGNRTWNHCTIELRADDTYTMVLGKITIKGWVRKKEFEGVYWDQLKGLFERTTGLYLSL